MRINRTFSIPIEIVRELKKKHNQSETVTRALKKYLDPSYEHTLNDSTTIMILRELQMRFEPKTPEYELVKSLLTIIK
jgi:hypothetical protein